MEHPDLGCRTNFPQKKKEFVLKKHSGVEYSSRLTRVIVVETGNSKKEGWGRFSKVWNCFAQKGRTSGKSDYVKIT